MLPLPPWHAGTGPPRVPADGDLARGGGGWLRALLELGRSGNRSARGYPSSPPLALRATCRRPAKTWTWQGSSWRSDVRAPAKRRPYDTDARIRPLPPAAPEPDLLARGSSRVSCSIPARGIARSVSVGRRAGPRASPHDDRCFAATPPTPVSAPDGDEQHRGGRASTLARAIPDSAR